MCFRAQRYFNPPPLRNPRFTGIVINMAAPEVIGVICLSLSGVTLAAHALPTGCLTHESLGNLAQRISTAIAIDAESSSIGVCRRRWTIEPLLNHRVHCQREQDFVIAVISPLDVLCVQAPRICEAIAQSCLGPLKITDAQKLALSPSFFFFLEEVVHMAWTLIPAKVVALATKIAARDFFDPLSEPSLSTCEVEASADAMISYERAEKASASSQRPDVVLGECNFTFHDDGISEQQVLRLAKAPAVSDRRYLANLIPSAQPNGLSSGSGAALSFRTPPPATTTTTTSSAIGSTDPPIQSAAAVTTTGLLPAMAPSVDTVVAGGRKQQQLLNSLEQQSNTGIGIRGAVAAAAVAPQSPLLPTQGSLSAAVTPTPAFAAAAASSMITAPPPLVAGAANSFNVLDDIFAASAHGGAAKASVNEPKPAATIATVPPPSTDGKTAAAKTFLSTRSFVDPTVSAAAAVAPMDASGTNDALTANRMGAAPPHSAPAVVVAADYSSARLGVRLKCTEILTHQRRVVDPNASPVVVEETWQLDGDIVAELDTTAGPLAASIVMPLRLRCSGKSAPFLQWNPKLAPQEDTSGAAGVTPPERCVLLNVPVKPSGTTAVARYRIVDAKLLRQCCPLRFRLSLIPSKVEEDGGKDHGTRATIACQWGEHPNVVKVPSRRSAASLRAVSVGLTDPTQQGAAGSSAAVSSVVWRPAEQCLSWDPVVAPSSASAVSWPLVFPAADGGRATVDTAPQVLQQPFLVQHAAQDGGVARTIVVELSATYSTDGGPFTRLDVRGELLLEDLLARRSSAAPTPPVVVDDWRRDCAVLHSSRIGSYVAQELLLEMPAVS